VQILPPASEHPSELRLLKSVQEICSLAGLSPPEVGIYSSHEINAFATGPTRDKALIAVSSELMAQLDDKALRGIVAHELAHVANGDMVTMTLLQGLINSLVLAEARFFSSLFCLLLPSRLRSEFRLRIFLFLQIVLTLFGTLLVCYFSRRRELRADEVALKWAGPEALLAGLSALSEADKSGNESQHWLDSLKISESSGSWAKAFATHPSWEERLSKVKGENVRT
ncbi:MAG: M48 family metalloprotease, partial [Bdellovibrionales bacterium]